MAHQGRKEHFQEESKHNAHYAIAFALMELADAHSRSADALEKLGNGNAATDVGAVEGLSVQVEKIAKAIEGLDFRSK